MTPPGGSVWVGGTFFHGQIGYFPHILLFFAIACFPCGAVEEAGGVDFKDRAVLEESVSDNGTVTLRWEKAPDAAIELQQSSDEDFGDPVTRYQGTDPGSVITGLPEGVHYFRIREKASEEWSQALAMRVGFFPRGKLWVILSLGAAVVLATIATILAGHLKHRKEADG